MFDRRLPLLPSFSFEARSFIESAPPPAPCPISRETSGDRRRKFHLIYAPAAEASRSEAIGPDFRQIEENGRADLRQAISD